MVFTSLLVGSAGALGYVADRATRDRPVLSVTVTALATWTVLGGRSLGFEARTIDAQLRDGDLAAARATGDPPGGPRPSHSTRTGSRAPPSNRSPRTPPTAVVAPLWWGAVLGPAGLLGYRAANTLDARVGHRTPRLERFGWASARFDDLLNLVPARLTALLAVALGDDGRGAVRAWHRDARKHPSPNAGPVEAAFAGALGIRLGGTNVYHGVVEDRGTLGDGPTPVPEDIGRTARLASKVGLGAVATAVAVAVARRR